jgi:recombination protein RecT
MNAVVVAEPQDSIENAPAEHNGRQLKPFERAIFAAKDRFVSSGGGFVSYDQESIFAMQQLTKISGGKQYALDVANKNPGSVKLAMLNVAATGLTLNPAYGYAYLVPRDGAIVLDVSYKGILKIATDTGAILWGRADVVRERDRFIYRGPAAEPTFETENVFGDRGPVIGAYCVAKTREGDVMCGVMSAAELASVRQCSDLWAKYEKGPWKDFPEEMAKKAVIKRDAKTWPRTGKSGKLFEAIELSNHAEGGYTFEAEAIPRQLISDDRKARCDEASEQYAIALDVIKGAIRQWDETQDSAHLYTVAEAWNEIPRMAQADLWLAPTKGGVFTTHERDVIKTKLPKQEQE